ncbi:MAG: pyridoxamine 5'-phosphate oxidase family protein [Bacteroidota bacterium]
MPEKPIVDFIGDHHILTLAISRNNIPYCATCYYVYLKDENRFLFTSDPETRHIRDITEGGNYHVAGTIALETRIVGKIRGIQFTGTIQVLEGTAQAQARTAYLKRFPIARLVPGLHLWELKPDFIKLTDNRLGFGKKLVWQLENIMK